MVTASDRAWRATTRELVLRTTRPSPVRAAASQTSDASGKPATSSCRTVAHDSAIGTDPRGTDRGNHRHAASFSYSAATVELQRTGGDHAYECRIRDERRARRAEPKTDRDSRIEPQLQSA